MPTTYDQHNFFGAQWILNFYRFGLARSKRDLSAIDDKKPEGVCPTRTHFIHPRVAFSVKGQWLFIVNLPGRADQQQGIVTEECT